MGLNEAPAGRSSSAAGAVASKISELRALTGETVFLQDLASELSLRNPFTLEAFPDASTPHNTENRCGVIAGRGKCILAD